MNSSFLWGLQLIASPFLFFFHVTSVGAPSFSWNLDQIGDQYNLSIDTVFPEHVSLVKAVQGFKDLHLLATVSTPIVGGHIKLLNPRNYQQTLVLENFFIKSQLISNCKEEWTPNSWVRRCDLDTSRAAGKLSMIKKFDEVHCELNISVRCHFDIRGQAKDLVIAGIPLMKAEKLVLKGKYEALKNFAKIWVHIFEGGLSSSRSLKKYNDLAVSKQIEKMFQDGTNRMTSAASNFRFISKHKYELRKL